MGLLEAFTPESFERQFATNVFGPHRVDRAFLPGMRERRSGLVIFVSSVVGRFVSPFIGVYAASKFALEAMAETLSYELRSLGVDVAIVEPGAFATEIMGKMIQPDDSQRVAAYGAMATQLGEKLGAAISDAGDPQIVADAVLALVRLPAGARPLRTVIPADMPVTNINDAVAPIQRSMIEAFGLGELLPDRQALDCRLISHRGCARRLGSAGAPRPEPPSERESSLRSSPVRMAPSTQQRERRFGVCLQASRHSPRVGTDYYGVPITTAYGKNRVQRSCDLGAHRRAAHVFEIEQRSSAEAATAIVGVKREPGESAVNRELRNRPRPSAAVRSRSWSARCG